MCKLKYKEMRKLLITLSFITSVLFFDYAPLYSADNAIMAHGWSYEQDDSQTAIEEAIIKLKESLKGVNPAVIFVSSTTYNLDMSEMITKINDEFPDVPIWGASSALGIMMNNEYDYMKGDAVGLVALCSDDYYILVEGASIDNFERSYVHAGKSIIKRVVQAKKETPQLILFTSNPGPHEEAIIEEIKKNFGKNVPIYGGSAGTETPSPRYSLANSEAYLEGVSLAFIYTSKRIGYQYQMGYKPENKRGVATRAEGRWLYEIDGKSALEVYNQWADGFFTKNIEEGKNIRGEGQMYHPLAMVKKDSSGNELIIALSAKDYSRETGAIEFFASVEEGDTLTILKGDTNSLINRGYLAVTKAKKMIKGKMAGGLAFNCSGARLLLEKKGRTSELGSKLKRAFKDKPFLLMFHNGEHGNIYRSESFHGNLMLDVVVFGE